MEELGQIVFCCYNVDISCSIDGWYEFWEAVNIEVSYLTHTLHVRCHQGRGNNLWLMLFDCSGYKSQEGSNVQDVFGITIYFCSNLAACQALEQYVKNKSRFDGCGLWWPPFFLETFKSCVNSPCRGFDSQAVQEAEAKKKVEPKVGTTRLIIGQADGRLWRELRWSWHYLGLMEWWKKCRLM